jgi:hypothetical protein
MWKLEKVKFGISFKYNGRVAKNEVEALIFK